MKKTLPISLISLLISCGSSDSGGGDAALSILLEPEDAILEGLTPGDDGENIQDGWAVTFQKYIVSVGGVELRLSTDSDVTVSSPLVLAVDLTQIEARGLPLATLEDLKDGRWDFFYSVTGQDSLAHESVSDADFSVLKDSGASYLIAATLTKEGGVSCPPSVLGAPPEGLDQEGENGAGDPCYPNAEIRFEWAVEAGSVFGPCEIDGIPGVTTTSGTTSTAAITIHGDHLFFNGFPEGSEGGTMRLAQWLADCDLDLDGQVTMQELSELAPADLAEFDERYVLGGSPITPLDSMAKYVRAQLLTQGHFQGEGECAFSLL